jgi:hypothetical protein
MPLSRLARLPLLPLLLASCDGEKPGDDTGFVDDGEPHIFITAPEAGAAVSGCFDLVVEVYNFTLVNPVESPDVTPGEGHWHAVFGPRFFDCESDRCAIALTEEVAADTTVTAQLVGSDHNDVENSLGDDVEDERTFAYDGEPCPDAR